MAQIIRQAAQELIELHGKSRGRLIVLTGARQTGKSTLAKMAFPELPVINLDSPVEREAYARMAPAEWIARYPHAVIDEAQKLPEIFDTIKACYDRDPEVRYLLLGSSQVLLLNRTRETLAGRAALRELFPLSLVELCNDGARAPARSRLVSLLEEPLPQRCLPDLFPPDLVAESAFGTACLWWERYLRFGGMPALWQPDWTDRDRLEWLRDYHATYLQRDLLDLARLDRLEPFVRAQRAIALMTSQLVNVAELARLADVQAATARQFVRYLELSYQVAWLPGWYRNQEKRLVKRAKLHFLDPGVRRAVANRTGATDGAEYESAVAASVIGQARTARLPLSFHHLRTVDGREVDLLIEREDGFVAIECKLANSVHGADARHLRHLETLLDKPLLLGLVVSDDPRPRRLFDDLDNVWAVPAAGLFAAPFTGAR